MHLINRELSWLEFNQRVLSEASQENLPPLERVKFLAISASNLDEFHQVRVGSLSALIRTGNGKKDPSGLTPNQQMSAIRKRVKTMVADQYLLWTDSLLPLLESHNLRIVRASDLSAEQRHQNEHYFQDSLQPLLTPLDYDPKDPTRQHLLSLSITLAARLQDNETNEQRTVFVSLPSSINRFSSIQNSTDHQGEILLPIEDLIAQNLHHLFPGECVLSTCYFRLTRNSDIAVQEEDTLDLAGEMEEVLIARRSGHPVRLEIPKNAPAVLVADIRSAAGCRPSEILRIPHLLDLSSLMEIAFLPSFDHLRNSDWSPQASPAITPSRSLFETIAEHDLCLIHPYESFDPVLNFLEEAAKDPQVLAIKQVLYRTARNSRIVRALQLAAENGKSVTALVELKARFDESQNIERAETLRRYGVQVVYGVKGLKTHAKISLIIRNEEGILRRYVHLGTGNYNEATARIYSDISYLTCRPEYGADASSFFNAVTGRSKLLDFQKLSPAPTHMKQHLLDLLESETARAKNGDDAQFIGKMNSLEDLDMIEAIIKAARAGVQVRLNIRGICCLSPAIGRGAKNLQIISIIDRFLEHSRVFYFHQGGTPKVFIASADWMTRNLEKRIELLIPIEDPASQKRLIGFLKASFKDNQQSHLFLKDGTSRRLSPAPRQRPYRFQQVLQQQAEKDFHLSQLERATTFHPHTPPK